MSLDCVSEISNNFDQALIFTDALDMKSARYSIDGKEAPLIDVAIRAVEAGDQVLVFGDSLTLDQYKQIKEAMLNRFQTDDYFKTQVYMAVRNIIKHKLFTNEY